jgi:hypothetical protein
MGKEQPPVKVEIVTDKPIPVELKGKLGKELLTTGISAALGRAITRLVDMWMDNLEKPEQTQTAPAEKANITQNQPIIVQQAVSTKVLLLLLAGGIILATTQVHSCSEINKLKAKVVELENKDCNNLPTNPNP